MGNREYLVYLKKKGRKGEIEEQRGNGKNGKLTVGQDSTVKLTINGLDIPNKRQLEKLRQNISTLNPLTYKNNMPWPNVVCSKNATFENELV